MWILTRQVRILQDLFPSCGYNADRDTSASMNILLRYLSLEVESSYDGPQLLGACPGETLGCRSLEVLQVLCNLKVLIQVMQKSIKIKSKAIYFSISPNPNLIRNPKPYCSKNSSRITLYIEEGTVSLCVDVAACYYYCYDAQNRRRKR